MAAKIHSFRPLISIIHKHGQDIATQLGDVGTVTLSKNLYQPAGQFSIAFGDMPIKPPDYSQRKSVYDIVDVCDAIEVKIQFWDEEAKNMEWVTVLRGFIKDVGREEQVDGSGRVARQVVIAGMDCGAPLIMEQLSWWITAMQTDVPVTAWNNYFRMFGLIEDPLPASDWVRDCAIKTTEHIMGHAGWAYSLVMEVEKGYVLPWEAFSQGGSIWEILKRHSDAPWNELFVREGADNPELVFRPTAWKDIDDEWLPDAKDPGKTTIKWKDVISSSVFRDDTEQVQGVIIQNVMAHAGGNFMPLAQQLGRYPAADELRARFGDKIQMLQEMLGPSYSPIHNKEEDQQVAYIEMTKWLTARYDWCKRAGRDIFKFEHGSLTLRGNPKIQVGTYLEVDRGAYVWAAYVIGVTHQYKPFTSYTTKVEFIRSNNWKKRQEVQGNIWDLERKQAG